MSGSRENPGAGTLQVDGELPDVILTPRAAGWPDGYGFSDSANHQGRKPTTDVGRFSRSQDSITLDDRDQGVEVIRFALADLISGIRSVIELRAPIS